MKRWIWFPVLVIGFAGIGLAGYWGYASGQSSNPTKVEAPATVTAATGDVQLTVTGPGRSVDGRAVTLEAELNAAVATMLVQSGDQVQQGQVLARLGPQEQFEAQISSAYLNVLDAEAALQDVRVEEKLAQAELDLLEAQKELEKAQKRAAGSVYQRGSQASVEAARADFLLAEEELKQAEDLYQSLTGLPENDYQRVMALSQLAEARKKRDRAKANLNYLLGKPSEADKAALQAELDLAEARVAEAQQTVDQLRNGEDPETQLAKAKVEVARREWEAAQANLARLEIKAPFDGVVTEVHVQAGQAVTLGTALLSLTDPSVQEVECTVVEEDLPLLQVGQTAQLFFDALQAEEVTGKVSRIIPKRVEGDRAVYTVIIALDQVPAALLPGMSVDASVIVAHKAEVLTLPRSVVRAQADGTAKVEVWVDDHKEPREIQVGLRGDSLVEVVSGLQPGEQVVAE